MPSPFRNISSMDDIRAIERTPWQETAGAESTYELIANAAAKFGAAPAIEYLPTADPGAPSVSISFSQLLHRINQAANLFHSLGVGATDVVSYALSNLPETHEIIWGAEAAGIVNAINPLLEPATIAHLWTAAKAKVFVTVPPMPGMNQWDAIVALADRSPALRAIVVVDPSAATGPAAALPERTPGGIPIIHYQFARDAQPGDRLLSGRSFQPTDIASLFHTGGTTGVPKLAPHTHRNEVFVAWLIANYLKLSPSEKTLVGLPLFHVNAVLASGLANLSAGATIVLATAMGYRSPGVIPNFWKLIARYRITGVSAVPTVYAAVMNVPKDGVDIRSLKIAGCGAAPLSPDLFLRFEKYTGVKLLEGYGLTESTVVASFNPLDGERRVGSVGMRMPYTEMECAVVERDRIVRFCDADEIGTIILRGPHVFPGYYGAETSGLLADGWLNTGDMGRKDAEGYFWLTGRSKDLIIRGGHNIDPAMIENVLAKHEAVAQVAAVGQPDAYAGELPCAFVELKPGATVNVDELRAWAKENIAERAAAPVHIEVVERMPVTAIGKIFKPPLRKIAIARVLHQALSPIDPNVTVDIVDDAKLGMVANITTNQPQKAQEIAGAFTVPYKLIG